MRNKKKQTDRFVLVLDRSPLSADDLRSLLSRNPTSKVRELIVIKHGFVVRAWP